MKIGLVTVAYNLAEATMTLWQSVARAEMVTELLEIEYHLFLHSQQPDVMAVCERIAAGPNVHYYDYGENRGLSNSWNEGILAAYGNGCDVVIVVNDDCIFGDGDVMALAHAAMNNRDRYMVTGYGMNHRHGERMPLDYSCFVINPIAIDRVGMFDENIVPIYFEDCDYSYRAETLLGLEKLRIDTTNIEHQGSGAIHADGDLMAQNHLTYGANSMYYVRKWGGLNDRERYTHPFNQLAFDAYIAPDRRHSPYGNGYDRDRNEIRELVKL